MTFDWFERNGYMDEVEEPVYKMWLCEYTKVMLRPDTIYKFEVKEDCDECVRLAAPYR
jgi:hypothetical protein